MMDVPPAPHSTLNIRHCTFNIPLFHNLDARNVMRLMKPAPTLLVLLMASALFAAEGDEIALNVPDAAVVDQNGRALRFRSDLVGDHLVVVNFVFTSCTTICSPMGANFAALQKRLGDKSDVRLISVSI